MLQKYSLVLLLIACSILTAQENPENMQIVRIDLSDDKASVRNYGDVASTAFSTARWCNRPAYPAFNLTSISPKTQQEFSITGTNITTNDFELGLYKQSGYSNTSRIKSYVTVGATNGRTGTAVSAGLWVEGEFVPLGNANSIYRYVGNSPTDIGSAFWRVDAINPTAKITWDAFVVPDNINVDNAQTVQVPVRNLGNGPLVISDISISGINSGDFMLAPSVQLPLTIPVDGVKMVAVIYSPQSAGTKTASLDFTSNTLAGPNSVSLGPVTSIACDGTTFSGTDWGAQGEPDVSKTAMVTSDYSTSDFGSIEACSLMISNNATLTIAAGDHLNISGDILIEPNSSLIIEHTGSLVQKDNAAIFTNNGNVEVRLTTGVLNARDFIMAGSPVESETREGAFGAGYGMLEHLTNLFEPNTDAAAAFPMAVNFVDDDFDQFQQYSGLINPGEGYLYRPQANVNEGGLSYDISFVGPVNTGEITYDVTYGDDPNDSPNILANPYPSAIWAQDIIAGNAMINEIYFWEHLTPYADYPDVPFLHYSMDDISYVNLSGGMAATNGGEAPSGYISTGQGFGIKATAAGTARFTNSMRRPDNNNTFRAQEQLAERIWLSVTNTNYDIKNSTLIAFNELATPEIDPGYDTRRLATGLSIYSHLPDGSEELGIQTREAFNTDAMVPVGFQTLIDEELTYKIAIDQLDGFQILDQSIYLIDLQESEMVDLSQTDYIFRASGGNFNQRFMLQFLRNSTFDAASVVLDAIRVFPNPVENVVKIWSPQVTINTIKITDVSGRVVEEANVNDDQYYFNMSYLQGGAYFVEINTTRGDVVKQVLKK